MTRFPFVATVKRVDVPKMEAAGLPSGTVALP